MLAMSLPRFVAIAIYLCIVFKFIHNSWGRAKQILILESIFVILHPSKLDEQTQTACTNTCPAIKEAATPAPGLHRFEIS